MFVVAFDVVGGGWMHCAGRPIWSSVRLQSIHGCRTLGQFNSNDNTEILRYFQTTTKYTIALLTSSLYAGLARSEEHFFFKSCCRCFFLDAQKLGDEWHDVHCHLRTYWIVMMLDFFLSSSDRYSRECRSTTPRASGVNQKNQPKPIHNKFQNRKWLWQQQQRQS